jgi:hypothetical protein
MLHHQIQYHRIPTRLEVLATAAEAQTWEPHHTEEYQKLDDLITESMLHAERQVGRHHTAKFKWSPKLKLAVMLYRYWTLRLRQLNYPRPFLSLPKYIEEGHVPHSLHLASLTKPEIVAHLHQSLADLRHYQKCHHELREEWLSSLAEALVLDQHPELSAKDASSLCSLKKTQQLRQLRRRERMRKSYFKLKKILKSSSPT